MNTGITKTGIIGIDIDGVITDEIHPNENVWHNALCEYLGYQIERVKDSYYFDEAYDLKDDIITAFLEEKLESIYRDSKIDKIALDTINKLYDREFKIHLITAREKQFEDLTRNWLDSNGLKYTSLDHEDKKAPLAESKEIELFIEDNAYNASELSKRGIRVILLNKYHNQYLEKTENIIRVDNWDEIDKEINNYFNIK